MSYVITLIAPHQSPSFDDAAIEILRGAGIDIKERVPLCDGIATDLFCAQAAPKALMEKVREECKIDILCQQVELRNRRLFFADMDATIVAEETLDELAGHVGLKDKIAAITQRAMNGELDFKEALRMRVGLLEGLPESALADTAAKVTYNAGAKDLLAALKNHGLYCVLVSGGFTYFTQKIADAAGFDENHGNRLDIANATLTGKVLEPILDKNFKQKCLMETAEKLGIPLTETIAIGDGANDLPMLQTAGLGIGWRSKPVLREALDNHLLYCNLDVIPFALGFKA